MGTESFVGTCGPCKSGAKPNDVGILVSFYFIGSVGFELPFSTFPSASCYKGKGNQ
jgi:hypothetical protein